MTLNPQQIQRYARHLLLKEVGGQGQAQLLKSRVLVVGAGGLGAPLLLYLAAAGVGRLGIVDDDTVDLSNLQRQVIHTTADIGRQKTLSAEAAITALNPDVTVDRHSVRLTAANALDLIAQYDLIADGSDTYATRALVNDACFFARKPLVSAAVGQFDGQLATFKPYAEDKQGAPYPCYRCLFPEPPPPGTVPTCAEAGILGAVTGVMGSLQALEVIKELLSIGDSLAGRLMIYDGLAATQRIVKIKPDPACALCSDKATIHDLSVHD